MISQLTSPKVAFIERPPPVGSASPGAQPSPDGAEQGRSIMVKHYVKYAFSTLTAAMFASMV
ncbi:hypothetical protein [Streptomyces sp. SID3212]|uniref:hypothetical protein n=1 Tax=Streptomyces sp. SID3212 TaxID=2690259 RepID=UPI00192553A7|nr:hypothetical protein [Streptomyces sp. SID3212]